MKDLIKTVLKEHTREEETKIKSIIDHLKGRTIQDRFGKDWLIDDIYFVLDGKWCPVILCKGDALPDNYRALIDDFKGIFNRFFGLDIVNPYITSNEKFFFYKLRNDATEYRVVR